MNLRNPEMRGGDYKSGGSLRAFRRLSFYAATEPFLCIDIYDISDIIPSCCEHSAYGLVLNN